MSFDAVLDDCKRRPTVTGFLSFAMGMRVDIHNKKKVQTQTNTFKYKRYNLLQVNAMG